MNLSKDYIIQCIYKYAHKPKRKKYTNVYTMSCTFCREGNSWGKKQRLYYMVDDNYFFCHNCQKSIQPLNWISDVSGLKISEILKEASEFEYNPIQEEKPDVKKSQVGTLPDDSINLFDAQQLSYYKNNRVVQDALEFIKRRKIDIAINKPRAIFISLKDFVHKNRLCIPFYDKDNQIVFYQTRAIYKNDEINRPKYLSKIGAEKTIFGVRNIDVSLDTLFITEGPIDSMFIRNGLAIGGISLTETQEIQLSKYKLLNRIWILDNQLDNKEVKNKMNELIERGETVFIWPDKYSKFKDINDVCVENNLSEISPQFFINNSFEGMNALLKIR